MLRTLTRTLAAVLLPAVVLAACGDDDDDAAADAGHADVGVTAVDYGYEGLPASVLAGTRFELMNDSKAEVHELVAIRLPDDEVRPVEEIFQLPPRSSTSMAAIEQFEPEAGEEPPEPDGGPPHIAQGMFAELVVR